MSRVGLLRIDANMLPLEQLVPPSALLGYLNFSNGRPDPRWQKHFNEAFGWFGMQGDPQPWQSLLDWLQIHLPELAETSSAFRDVNQANEILNETRKLLKAYRNHHVHLLAHLSDSELYQPYFLVRCLEALLQQRAISGPGLSADSIPAVLARLNDYVGYRPVAILETRPQGEPYNHERHRPVPLYLRGAGVAWGPYQALLTETLAILRDTAPEILRQAQLDLDCIDEIAMDVRAYDHGHPVNRRPNYVFGEWDPHQIDLQGQYRRYVIRMILLTGLNQRIQSSTEGTEEERTKEAAAVLAGTILMAMGVTGNGPGAMDSSVSLGTLLPRIARYRDQFYEQLLPRFHPKHAERLKKEQSQTRQAFGAARQHLNAFLARHRALQMQQRHLAVLYATMGYAEASQEESKKIPCVSARLLSSVLGELTSGIHQADRGQLTEAMKHIPVAERLLQEGIACGAFLDPWNILGFQALFPLSPAREDSLRDARLDDLLLVMEGLFNLYTRVIGDEAALGARERIQPLLHDLQRLASWWDQFATSTVSDIHRIQGMEITTATEQLAQALIRWHERGETPADLAFWRDQLDQFHSPRAFALVIETLLRKQDYRASMALLISWVSQGEQISFQEGNASFHHLVLRWMLALAHADESSPGPTPLNPLQRKELIVKFFDYLEANSETYWQAPSLGNLEEKENPKKKDDRFDAAYESVTYQDSTDDDQESAIDEGPVHQEYSLEGEADSLENHLRFLATLARLWQIGSRCLASRLLNPQGDLSAALSAPESRHTEDVSVLINWLNTARERLQQLLTFLDSIHAFPIPEPSGDYDSLIEYDRHRAIKERLLFHTLNCCLDISLAVGGLRGPLVQSKLISSNEPNDAPSWEPNAIQIEMALFRGDIDAVRTALDSFVENFQVESLLFISLNEGGNPREILRVRLAQTVLRALLSNLPRLGLFRETFDLLRTARTMERERPAPGRGVTEFNNFFQTGFQSVVENLVEASTHWEPEQATDVRLVEILENLTAPFLSLWIEHSRTLLLSVLENIQGEPEWRSLQQFIQSYGKDLFHARFMTLSNLRSIIHRGVKSWLTYLQDNPDPLHPIHLLHELNRRIRRTDAIRYLELVLNAIIENYEEYKDYNTTSTQSDYGENLYVLIELLRMKAAYDRHAWHFRPLLQVHEVLARHGRGSAAVLWERSLHQLTSDLARQHLEQLARIEQMRGIRLHTISDRLNERFTKPLALDRLCALIEPSINQSSAPPRDPASSVFHHLRQEIQAYTATPTGVGIDVPAWLRRLESEVHRAAASKSNMIVLADHLFRVPRKPITFEDLQDQLRHWDRPSLPQ